MVGGDQLGNVCRSALWERIDGWEVVAVVLLVMAGWSGVQIARMYFMAVVARRDGPATPPVES